MVIFSWLYQTFGQFFCCSTTKDSNKKSWTHSNSPASDCSKESECHSEYRLNPLPPNSTQSSKYRCILWWLHCYDNTHRSYCSTSSQTSFKLHAECIFLLSKVSPNFHIQKTFILDCQTITLCQTLWGARSVFLMAGTWS